MAYGGYVTGQTVKCAFHNKQNKTKYHMSLLLRLINQYTFNSCCYFYLYFVVLLFFRRTQRYPLVYVANIKKCLIIAYF